MGPTDSRLRSESGLSPNPSGTLPWPAWSPEDTSSLTPTIISDSNRPLLSARGSDRVRLTKRKFVVHLRAQRCGRHFITSSL